jgi:hypothetical protein
MPGCIEQGLPTSSDDHAPIQRRAEISGAFRWRDHDNDRRLQIFGVSVMRGIDRLASLINYPRLATGPRQCGPRRMWREHASCHHDRLAGDVSLRDRTGNDALSTDLADRDKAGLQVGVKSRLAAISEGANLVDGQISRFKTVLNRNERMRFLRD